MDNFIFSSKLQARKLEQSDLDSTPILNMLNGTANFHPFSYRLTKLNTKHNPTGGKSGKSYILDEESANKALPSLIAKPIHSTANWDAHKAQDGQFKTIGVTLGAKIVTDENGKYIDVIGGLWDSDFPEETSFIQADNGKLGASYELIGRTEKIDEDTVSIKDYSFGGSAILFKEDAAIYNTEILYASSAEGDLSVKPTNKKNKKAPKDKIYEMLKAAGIWQNVGADTKCDECIDMRNSMGWSMMSSEDPESVMSDDEFGIVDTKQNSENGRTVKIRRYPLGDIQDAFNSLGYIMHDDNLSPEQKIEVADKIRAKYPLAVGINTDGNMSVMMASKQEGFTEWNDGTYDYTFVSSDNKSASTQVGMKKTKLYVEGGLQMEICDTCKKEFDTGVKLGEIVLKAQHDKDVADRDTLVASKDAQVTTLMGEKEILSAENAKLKADIEILNAEKIAVAEQKKADDAKVQASKEWDDTLKTLYAEESKNEVIDIMAKIYLGSASVEEITKLTHSRKPVSGLPLAGGAADVTGEAIAHKAKMDALKAKAQIRDTRKYLQ